MKKIILIIASLSILIACSKEEKIELNDEFMLAFNQSLSIESENIAVKFIEVKEERCPDGPVACFWQGVAEVKIEITNESETTALTLGTLSCDSRPFLSGLGQCVEKELLGYLFKLTSVDPYPNIDILAEENEYIVKLIITKI